MAANNQGIAHLRIGKRDVACKRLDAHIAVRGEAFEAEPRKCVRCAAKWTKMLAIAARQQGAA